VQLTFLGKNSSPDQSPTLYTSDRDTYIVQGWIVTDPEIVSLIEVSADETLVEVPADLMAHLAKDGLPGEVTNVVHPIVHVTPEGNYIVRGARVTDAEALTQMNIPEHETCVEIAKSAVAVLVGA
jgi:hypothetical protein